VLRQQLGKDGRRNKRRELEIIIMVAGEFVTCVRRYRMASGDARGDVTAMFYLQIDGLHHYVPSFQGIE
jgi:hypothetical protein